MNHQQLWIPKAVVSLPILLVRNNGTPDTCRCQEIGRRDWQDKPRSILVYYRPATEAEEAELLPQAA